jgi:AICAR transformylase/IMP cyclohydrolase PurH
MIPKKKIIYQNEHKLSSAAAYEELEERCQISMDTMKKTINNRIRVTRNFLYKFTVGLHMTLDEANEYFALSGGTLRESCLADYICIHALLDQDDINEFIKDFEKHTEFKLAIRGRQGK